jgi:type II secretory pathway pseudopilin PulG
MVRGDYRENTMDEGRKKGLRAGGAANKPSRGFSAAETVVTVVVLAILSAYAAPKLFGVKEQADAAEETLKIKDIEARHSQEMLKAGKRGSNPILGDVVGFRPEVVAEPAPDEAPVLYSYSYYTLLPYSPRSTAQVLSTDLFGYRPLNSPPYGSGQNWADTNGDKMSGCEELVSGIKTPRFIKRNSEYIYLLEMNVSKIGDDYQVPHSNPVPGCAINSFSYKKWCNSTSTSCQTEVDIPPEAFAAGYSKTWTTVYSFSTDHSYNTRLSPTHYRYSCQAYTDKFGVEYQININDSEPYKTLPITRVKVSDSPIAYEQSYANVYPPPPQSGVMCVRVGAAPEAPPSDPGDPGAYPMAADHSGYCLSPGRKLPTYRDSNGTPTSSASDPVMELATDAVDDPTNCP